MAPLRENLDVLRAHPAQPGRVRVHQGVDRHQVDAGTLRPAASWPGDRARSSLIGPSGA